VKWKNIFLLKLSRSSVSLVILLTSRFDLIGGYGLLQLVAKGMESFSFKVKIMPTMHWFESWQICFAEPGCKKQSA